MNSFLSWLDHRTGYKELLHEALFERIPGGARWRYVWGSTLVFTFVLQVITGLCLWSAYSPSVQTAWESVYYIQEVMFLGSVVRGLHHFAAQAMVVLMAIHLMQVIIDGAYKAPREVNFWLGLVLMQVVLALGLTGYLLPWDQKGYYATQVSTEIMGATPVVGRQLQELVQGGPEYGHHTLTRFFALHAGVLPATLVGFLALHIYVFRRHGIHAKDPSHAPEGKFWPEQVLKDAVACLGVLAVLLLLAVFKGAELSAPANPAENFKAARPEWYFLFMFRFLRFEAIEHFGLAFGAIYVPGALMGILALMPIIAMWKKGHAFNVAFMWLVMAGAGGLTALAIYEDANDPAHQVALEQAEEDAHRVKELASRPEMIPVEGAMSLLLNDPLTQGPKLFKQNCSACHRYNGHDGTGEEVMVEFDGEQVAAPATAADLGNFGNREWFKLVLTDYSTVFEPLKNNDWYKNATDEDEIIDPDEGEMAAWSEEHREMLTKPENAEDLAAIIEFLAAQTERTDLGGFDDAKVQKGRGILESYTLTDGELSTTCTDCHGLHAVGDEEAMSEDTEGYPTLTSYASKAWLKDFISNPGSPRHYGSKNRMTAYVDKMSARELEILAAWMAGDYYRAEPEEAEESEE